MAQHATDMQAKLDVFLPTNRKVNPPPVPTFPAWFTNLWLGWPGQQEGELGLLRSTLRKFARQLANALSMASQTASERRMPAGIGAGSWSPSVVIEGRVQRRVGPLVSNAANEPRYSEMYVHDAMHGDGDATDQPSVVVTQLGQCVVLPSSATGPEKVRVSTLFERMFAYIRTVNEYVQSYQAAAEELQNLSGEQEQHTVMILRGRRSTQAQDSARSIADRTFDGQQRSTAGGHGTTRGLPEVCVLCPRTLAQEECHVSLRLRNGRLRHVPIEHRAFDTLYHTLLHPTGQAGWELSMPLRRYCDALATLPATAIRPGRHSGRSTAFTPRQTVSMLQFYANRLHWHQGHNQSHNCLFMSNRLCQEYACVAFWRVETSRLNYHRLNQESMRQAPTDELRNFVAEQAVRVNAGQAPSHDVGRVSYIPESFVGGPSDMYARYQDAMCAVLRRGWPSLFITMTANPKWREVKDSLPYAQTPQDRYDIISRVFKQKLDSLLGDLKAGGLGVQVLRCHVIEFQKRGLPHAHIVVTLAEADRPRTPEQVDSLSSAEVPPLPAESNASKAAVAQRRLRALVLEHMVHNDCASGRGPSCPCWDKDKKCCRGNFPFEFHDETTMGDEQTKSRLRRRDGSARRVTMTSRIVDNRWVVPYNASLLLKYECHLNVEVVTAAYAVKYLFKYCFKGCDNASAAVQATMNIADRIGTFQDLRYIGASEAIWRLFGYGVAALTESVMRFSVSLPEQRILRFRDEEEDAAAQRGTLITPLDGFVEFCQSAGRLYDQNDAWKELTLCQFPEHYTWNQDMKEWVKREGRGSLGRMYVLHPNKGDAYYLRLLLTQLKGADIRVLGNSPRQGVHSLKGTMETFKDACLSRGLLADDGEWFAAMEEAHTTAMPHQLRALFLHIISFCTPQRPLQLFEKYCLPMGDDFRQLLSSTSGVADSDVNVRACVICKLSEVLDRETLVGRTAADMLPPLTDDDKRMLASLGNGSSRDLSHIYGFDRDDCLSVFEENYRQCSNIAQQQELVDIAIRHANSGEQLLLFVDAPGGCGKTFCMNTIADYYRGQGKAVLSVATTGIAALQLKGGRTVHTGLKVPVDPSGTKKGPVQLTIEAHHRLGICIIEHLRLIIWDEAPMINKDIFDGVDKHFRMLRRNDAPFGGLSVICCGDFRQCLPVVRGGSRHDQVAASINNSEVFQQFGHFHLYDNIRVRTCMDMYPEKAYRLQQWAEDLMTIGNGHLPHIPDSESEFEGVIPPSVNCHSISSKDDVDAMINNVFGTFQQGCHDRDGTDAGEDEPLLTSILCPVNVAVDYINKRCLQKWPGESITLQGYDSHDVESDATVIPIEQLNQKTPSGSPPIILEVKPGVPLVLLRNMADGLMNGTRLEMLEVRDNRVMICRVLTGLQVGRIVYIPRFIFKHEGTDQPLPWLRRQFPVKLAWAMTINKSQGQTLSRVAICLVRCTEDGDELIIESLDVFSHGQLYVALSRCGDPDEVCVYMASDKVKAGTVVNVVYSEALPTNGTVVPQPAWRQPQPRRDEDDIMYEPRTVRDPIWRGRMVTVLPAATEEERLTNTQPQDEEPPIEEPFDVPAIHGYVFENEGECQWDGSLQTLHEYEMNEANSFAASVFLEHTMNES